MPDNMLAHELTMLILNGKITLSDIPQFVKNYNTIYFQVINCLKAFNN